MEAPNPNDAAAGGGDYRNSWNSHPINPCLRDDLTAVHQLEAIFNRLNLSQRQSRPIMTGAESSTLFIDQPVSSLYHGGGGGYTGEFRQHNDFVTSPMGGGIDGYNASVTPPMGGGIGGYYGLVRGGGNRGISYEGNAFYPSNNIGYGHDNPNLNLNRLSPATSYNPSLYHPFNNSTPLSSNNIGGRFCLEQPLNNNIRSISYSSRMLPEAAAAAAADLHNIEGNNVYLMAKTQHGRRNLQKIFDEGVPEKINMIFCHLKDHIHELMKHQCGNITIQKMFEVCNVHQITELVRCLLRYDRHLLDVCIDNHGTRAMQKLLGYLRSYEQRHLLLSFLRRVTLHLTKDANGHHIIERCFDLFPREETLQILNVVAAHCVDIAANKSGCCLLQHCILNEEAIDPLNHIVAEITLNSLSLSVDQYGNYVVQYIVGLKMDNATREIVNQLSGNFINLSLDKYGSHVVEKCINFCPQDQAMKIIEEMITSQDFLAMLQDPYGNFVAQSAFRVSKGTTRAMMVNLIKKNHHFLHSHPHGKKVLDKIVLSKTSRLNYGEETSRLNYGEV